MPTFFIALLIMVLVDIKYRRKAQGLKRRSVPQDLARTVLPDLARWAGCGPWQRVPGPSLMSLRRGSMGGTSGARLVRVC